MFLPLIWHFGSNLKSEREVLTAVTTAWKTQQLKGKHSLITLWSGCGCNGISDLLISVKDSDSLEWIRHTLSQNSLISSIIGLFRIPDIQTDPFSGNAAFIISQGNFQWVWTLGIMGIAPSCSGRVHGWTMESQLGTNTQGQPSPVSPTHAHTHRYTWISEQSK